MTGAVLKMAKGRKRHMNAPRHPSGKIVQVEGLPPAKIQRMIRMAEEGAADELLAIPLGWLRLRGELNSKQVAAGLMFSALVGQHDKLKGYPRRSTASPSYERGFIGSGGEDGIDPIDSPDTDPDQRKFLIAQREAVTNRYNAAHKAVMGSGLTATRAVYTVCVDNEAPPPMSHEYLRAGLTALAEHFRINEQGRG